MSARVKVLLIVLLVPMLAYGALTLAVGRDGVWPLLFGPGNREPVFPAAFVSPGSPNWWLVCPPGLCAAASAESPVFAVPADRLRAEVERMLVRDGARIEGGDARRIAAEVRTPLLRFPDLVSVEVRPLDGERSTLAILSRSVYGHSDLGTNRRRVTAWLDTLRRAFP
ncbi:DUF1499 domain-containing protein [Azospirillum sp. RWY-5-1]|uniref:DUF1499 domain-containing protein n=1 Tax=Azospirillum oleiclasticum TaxID=2735135 RepID=A0ABX2T548_9PROT|nr:DUF1499 domain-containing protein [Azospirillum oleiclasticum]NYZ11266.1 DUF1499 domain-containing protein [Azospirillum oleiclasticum]NYZ18427.1 DUF1499 domain-containing protein [Azospirillum oleiclasticum]